MSRGSVGHSRGGLSERPQRRQEKRQHSQGLLESAQKHRRDPEAKEKLERIYFRLAVAEMADARDELQAEERGKERTMKLFRYSLDRMADALNEANAGLMEIGRMQPYLGNARSFAVTALEQEVAHEFGTGPYAGLVLVAQFLSDGRIAIGDDDLDELANPRSTRLLASISKTAA
jgi:hypothetical protein